MNDFSDQAFSENDYVEMSFKGPILYFKCKEDIVVDKKSAQCISEDMTAFTKGKPVAAFVDFRGVKYFSITAMSLVSTKNYIASYKALAILLGSYPQVIIGNFFLYIYNQDVPVKMFYDQENAMKWLEKIQSY